MASASKTLEITLISARDLKDVVTFGRMDPYCVVTISNSPAKQRTPTARNAGTNPVWNAKVAFSVQESQLHVAGATVVIQIMHDGSLGNTLIGTANIPLKEFLTSSGKHDSTGFQVLTKSGRPKGYVNVNLSLMSGDATHGHPSSQQLPFPTPPGSASAPAIPGPYSSASLYGTAPSGPHFMPSAPPQGAYPPQAAYSGPPPPGPAPYPAQPSPWESHPAKPEKPSSSSTGAIPYPAQPGMPYPPPQQNGQAPVTAYPVYPGYPPSGAPGAYHPPPHPGAYPHYPPPPPGAYPPQGYHQQPHYPTASAYAQRPHNSRYGQGHGGGVGGGALFGAGAGLLGGLIIGDMIGDAMDGDCF